MTKNQQTEALGVEFASHGTDAGFARLTLLQTTVKFFLQSDDLEASRWHAAHRLDPQRQIFRPFSAYTHSHAISIP